MAFLSRRHFLSMGVSTLGSLLIPSQVKALILPLRVPKKVLTLHNTHTGEHLKKMVYWAEGRYLPEALEHVAHFLRDWRTGDVTKIDPRLLDVIHNLKSHLSHNKAFDVICGYRSPQTNDMLCQKSAGVAKKSLHMQGRAVDIRFSKNLLKLAHRAACSLRAGGVGLYPGKRDRFIHIDVRPRFVSWTG